MLHPFEQFLLPEQSPGRWQPGQAIQVLPLLRGAYPDCLNDDLLDLALVDTGSTDTPRWILRATRVDHARLDADVLRIAPMEDRGAIRRLPAGEYPMEILNSLTDTAWITPLEQAVGLFRPASHEMLRRVVASANAEERELRHAEVAEAQDEGIERIDFLHSLVRQMAAYLADPDSIAEVVIRRLKAEPAWGLRAESHESKWVELGAEASQPSILHSGFRSNVRALVLQTFERQPLAVQLAQWFESVWEDEYPGGRDALEWYAPSADLRSLKVEPSEDVVAELVSTIMARAEEDHDDA